MDRNKSACWHHCHCGGGGSACNFVVSYDIIVIAAEEEVHVTL